MHTKRTHLAVPAMIALAVGLWLLGRHVLQPGMDYVRERASPEVRVLWFLLTVGVAVAIVSRCMDLAYGRRDQEDEDQ